MKTSGHKPNVAQEKLNSFVDLVLSVNKHLAHRRSVTIRCAMQVLLEALVSLSNVEFDASIGVFSKHSALSLTARDVSNAARVPSLRQEELHYSRQVVFSISSVTHSRASYV